MGGLGRLAAQTRPLTRTCGAGKFGDAPAPQVLTPRSLGGSLASRSLDSSG